MGRETGPACRLCRRVGEKLLLKGERCFTPKCAVERRRTPPGDQSQRRRRVSEWGIQLREKQKGRHTYGMMEKQFRGYMEKAYKKPGDTGQYLLEQLERRLDNTVFRFGFAESRRQARQLVRHGHFTVNGHKTDIPSYMVRPGEVIAWKESHKQREFFKALTLDIPKKPVPEWLRLDTETMTGTVSSIPSERDLESAIDTRLIVEYYSR
jgi:small subunit ribosomal protein S4